jgi:XTP/dITP diphosphohydrolase
MKPVICFATNNAHKLKEVKALLSNKFEVVGLQEIGCTEDIPETQATIEGNSAQKARFVKANYQKDCFADDTGLEVAALNNEPGVFSARYAGPQKNSEDNMQLLLQNLDGNADRSARFKTVITLILNGKEHSFTGIVNGHITEKKSGEKGFGYDPIFIPEGYNRTFVEMTAAEKNKISHRGLAVQQLVTFLEKR